MSLAFIAALVIVCFLIAFICSYVHYYKKAQKRFQTHGEPVNHMKILGESLLIAGLVGVICCIGAAKGEAKADRMDGNAGGGGDVEAQQPMSMPEMSMPEPQMNWEPMQSAAQDPIQV